METQKCNGNDQHVKPKTLVETLDHVNPQFYPKVTYMLSACDTVNVSCLNMHC